MIGVAAVWACERDGFDDTLRSHLASQDDGEPGAVGLRLLWAEDVMPATDWMIRHAREKEALDLARRVHEGHPVEIGPLTFVTREDVEPTRFLTVEALDVPSLPDQTGIPFWERLWISSELKEALFGLPEDGSLLRTYLIVDAAVRKNIVGMFDLDVVDVPVRCLFKGKAAESIKEAAPYILDMTLSDDVRDGISDPSRFHKDFFARHWGRNTGIFIRSTASMAEVWNHFRKFTFVPREDNGQRIFMRFWDEQYVRLYFPHIADNPERVATWFLRESFCIHSIMAEADDGKLLRKVTLSQQELMRSSPQPQSFAVTEYDLEPFYREREAKDIDHLAEALKDGFVQELANETAQTIREMITAPLERMRGYGFSRKGNLYLLGAWSIFFGKEFEANDPDGHLLEICQSSMGESAKMAALKKRMALLTVSTEATA
ncbi:DUF4123 domain-containing protein [Thalassospira xiamenensis]|uniref:DUF4123 domain-containing protein n=1 Tax=Thalassospira xiamenensis TaxID=220697 RepID=A0A367XHK6_9PROT|nr:DUF4123 domain-containing protein [Thalassospira xiamenensis]KZB51065.1 hypothetical protein AUP41_08140 [Thalassospira xiamenensis]MCK2167775.1 DUF4123 domain-containing protein [Thalassospira xiamenensis]RCK53154.1 hypothetical protein TH44_02825 [Thalassospira xiamenensis]